MNLGEAREAFDAPKLFGVVDTARMHDSRRVVIQTHTGDTAWGPIYEYREVEAVGTLFFSGEFTIVIAAGDLA